MATNGCFDHADCSFVAQYGYGADESAAWQQNISNRIGSFYAGYDAECISKYTWSVLDGLNVDICEEGPGSTCPPDGENTAEHRWIYTTYQGPVAAGAGFAAAQDGSSYAYWTQDFGGVVTPPQTNRIFTGTHYQNDLNTNFGSGTQFGAVFSTSTSGPTTHEVWIDGTIHQLILYMGTTARGLWAYTDTGSTGCRNYYFQFTDADATSYRFPDTGYLITYGEGATYGTTSNDDGYDLGSGCPTSFSPTLLVTSTTSPAVPRASTSGVSRSTTGGSRATTGPFQGGVSSTSEAVSIHVPAVLFFLCVVSLFLY